MSEHLGNHTHKKKLKLWKQMFIQAFAFDKYYHTHKKKVFNVLFLETWRYLEVRILYYMMP